MWFWRENSNISAFENKIQFLFQCWKLIELELLRFVMRRFKSRIFRKPFRIIDWIQNLQRRKNFTVMIHLSYLLSFQVCAAHHEFLVFVASLKNELFILDTDPPLHHQHHWHSSPCIIIIQMANFNQLSKKSTKLTKVIKIEN